MTQEKLDGTLTDTPRRYLITGAEGFIGEWIAEEMVEGGDQPYVFDVDTGNSRPAALLTP